ncbi:universal stress protein [Dictyobacter aurantiacus]|uniref:Universal stress protein UspA n=1 Tax=Dictyobacter aurantiacus TaxID=1936993 RepID=A0A401ZI53_9CHLR|nr:universal stress protein [Dictyobacter aurantiacus]GCE06527.1 universal stress protein UspA [Dictyobacter aurantiacus]
MFRRILLPLDGSHHAERTVPIALRLARTYSGTIILLRVVNLNWPSSTQSNFAQELPAHARFEAEQYLVKLAKKEQFQGIATEIQVPTGNETAMILASAQKQKADIILLNSHGYSGLTRWMMGSVAEKVTRYAEVPVLLLHGHSALPLGPHPDPTQPLRVLVPLDGSDYAVSAIEPAAELVHALAASANRAIHLVRTIDTTNELQKARHYLQDITTRIRQGEIAPFIAQQQIPVTWSVAVSRDAADAIIRVAENGEGVENSGISGGCDLVAMSTHGITGHPLWYLGSTTERVRIGTHLPMLIVRPAAIVEQETHLHRAEPEALVSEAQ